MRHSPKILNLLEAVCGCLDRGRYLDTRHVTERKLERNITRMEILYVLRTGFHEKKKDKFDEAYNSWNYAIRGKTMDARELRVIISFDKNNMLIITAMELA